MSMEKVDVETLTRVAGMVTMINEYTPGHCCLVAEGYEEIDPSIPAFTHGEQASVAKELLQLREMAEAMASAFESGDDFGGAIFTYREKYPKG